VTLAANQLDIGFQDRVTTVGNVINGKVRAIELSNNEEVSLLIYLQRLVRRSRCGSVVQVRGRMWILGVGDIYYRDSEMLLQRGNIVRCIVRAVV
jgi:hypothetical protein